MLYANNVIKWLIFLEKENNSTIFIIKILFSISTGNKYSFEKECAVFFNPDRKKHFPRTGEQHSVSISNFN